jgi:hypothetical protein
MIFGQSVIFCLKIARLNLFGRIKIFSKEMKKPKKKKRKSDDLPVGDKMQGCSGNFYG